MTSLFDELDLSQRNNASLQSGDFDGLSSLERLLLGRKT